MIVHDLVLYLTNKSLIKGNQIWEEEEESSPKFKRSQIIIDVDQFEDTELSVWRGQIHIEEYNDFLNLFKKFLGVQLNNKKDAIHFKE